MKTADDICKEARWKLRKIIVYRSAFFIITYVCKFLMKWYSASQSCRSLNLLSKEGNEVISKSYVNIWLYLFTYFNAIIRLVQRFECSLCTRYIRVRFPAKAGLFFSLSNSLCLSFSLLFHKFLISEVQTSIDTSATNSFKMLGFKINSNSLSLIVHLCFGKPY